LPKWTTAWTNQTAGQSSRCPLSLRPRAIATDARFIATPLKPCRAKARPKPTSCWSASSLTGKTVTIAKMRHTPVDLADGTKLVVTVHPSALLRIEDDNDKRAAYRDFVADLKAARKASRKHGVG
jgi:hypothetical protein